MESPRPQSAPLSPRGTSGRPLDHIEESSGPNDSGSLDRSAEPLAHSPAGPAESVQAFMATHVVDNPVAVAVANHLKYAPEVAQEGVNARPLRFADFRLLGTLGEGAMGTVYKARQISTNRDVALKVLFPHMARNPKLLERFYREARMMGRFDHPNIVSGYAVGEEHGRHYFAMEFV